MLALKENHSQAFKNCLKKDKKSNEIWYNFLDKIALDIADFLISFDSFVINRHSLTFLCTYTWYISVLLFLAGECSALSVDVRFLLTGAGTSNVLKSTSLLGVSSIVASVISA